MTEVVALAQALVRRPSVSPSDAGCQDLVAHRLEAAGFGVERLNFGATSNLVARMGEGPVRLMLNGHTDVVPPGDAGDWQRDPFSGELDHEFLYGRGASDMKGGVAAMVVALEQLAARGEADGLGLLLTSDEETSGADGTKRALAELLVRGVEIHAGFVAEPTSENHVGDAYKPGRRGSVTLRIQAKGEQGHVAYLPGSANVAHALAGVLSDLADAVWDREIQEDFPPTQMHVVKLEAGIAENVVPATAEAWLNWRNSPAAPLTAIQAKVSTAIQARGLRADLEWIESAEPFLTEPGPLRSAIESAIQDVCGAVPKVSTLGGTSDARWFAAAGIPVAEFGVVPIGMHGLDECVRLDELDVLVQVVANLCRNLR